MHCKAYATFLWSRWAHRTFLGLAIHAAELYQFSSIPGLLPRRLACEDSKVEQLFAAKSATAWKGILRNMALSANETARDTSRIPLDAFHIQALLGQVLMDIHNSRQLSQHCVLLQSRYEKPTQFYSIMLNLAQDCRIPLHNSQQDTLGCHIVFRVLWHYCYVDYWSQSGDIEAAVGRYGSNAVAHQALDRLRVWVNTPPARLAALHAVCVLSEAHSLKDIGFLIPRCVFPSSRKQGYNKTYLTQQCNLSFRPAPLLCPFPSGCTALRLHQLFHNYGACRLAAAR